MTNRAKMAGIIVILAVLAGIVYYLFMVILADERNMMVQEDGPIENASALLYFVAIALFGAFFRARAFQTYWYVPVVLLAMGLRELDAHKAITTMSIFKSRFYISSDVPLFEKIFGLGVIALLVFTAYVLLQRHLRKFLHDLRQFNPVAIAIFIACAFAGIAKTLDGIGRKLADIGILVPPEYQEIALSLEEVLELGIGVFFIYAILIHVRPASQ